MPPAVGMPSGFTAVFGGTKGGVPVPVVLVPANLFTSAAVPAPIAAFFSVLVKLLVGFVTGLVVVTTGFVVVVTGFVVVVLAATGGLVVVVLAAMGVFVVLAGAFVVVLAATGVLVTAGLRAVVVLVAAGFAAGFAVTGFAAGALIVEVTGGLGLACGALLVCTRETGAPEVVPRGVVAP
jgi:hypothetical protein